MGERGNRSRYGGFAVESIRRWWQTWAGRYPGAARLLITADCGGSNGARGSLWKLELQRFADETGLELRSICLPGPASGTASSTDFSYITQNWRGKPLVSHEVIVS